MPTDVTRLTGEQLLLMVVLGGRKDRARARAELDRRSLYGPPTAAARPAAALAYRSVTKWAA